VTLHVLVAGKTLDAVEAIRPALAKNDCQVIRATGVALALYLANKNYPDFVLCNSEMPDGNGLELLKELKSDPQLSKIPVVMMSETPPNGGFEQQALAAGADQVISGPIEPDTLFLRINRYLRELTDDRPEETSE
jgi:CheY-like chemotaxis protein